MTFVKELPGVLEPNGGEWFEQENAIQLPRMAITHAGHGERSQITKAETLAVPPAVADVTVERADHNSATISWRLSRRTDTQDLIRICVSRTPTQRLSNSHFLRAGAGNPWLAPEAVEDSPSHASLPTRLHQ